MKWELSDEADIYCDLCHHTILSFLSPTGGVYIP
jgi:hypothetical protein